MRCETGRRFNDPHHDLRARYNGVQLIEACVLPLQAHVGVVERLLGLDVRGYLLLRVVVGAFLSPSSAVTKAIEELALCGQCRGPLQLHHAIGVQMVDKVLLH